MVIMVTCLSLLQGGLMSDNVKAFLIVLGFIILCVAVGNTTRDRHRNEVCSIKGKSTYIYGGYEYSCLNGGRLK